MSRFPRRPIAVLVCILFAGVQSGHAATESSKRRQAKPAQSQKAKASSTKRVRPVIAARPGKASPRVTGQAVIKSSVLARKEEALPASVEQDLRLRVERKFNVLGRKKRKMAAPRVGLPYRVDAQKGDVYPMFLLADHIEGRTDESTVASGNVEFRKLGSVLYADKLTYWPLDDEVDASGNVEVLQEGSAIRSKHFRMRLSERVGFAEQIDYHVEKEVQSKFYRPPPAVVVTATAGGNAVTGAPMMLNVPNSYGLATAAPERRPSEGSGHAERADFEGENQIRLKNASYSTCKPGDHDWYLRASDMHLDYDQEVGNARNASVWVKDVPIFYSPLATFSLNHQRHSGLLSPVWSASTKNGIDVALPYYWAIAPNYEVTFLPRVMAKRGFQFGAEAQYLDQYARGSTRLEYQPKDQIEERNRYAYNIQHQHYLGRGFSAGVNWNGVSDDHYWEDMTSRLMQTTQTQLPKQLTLAYSPVPWLQTSAQVLRYQTLQPDPANPIARPYFLEPQINVVGYKPNLLKTDFSMIAQYSNFTHPDKVDGQRFVFYPQVSLPVIHPAFQITPKLGLHVTKYDLSQQAAELPNGLTRSVPTFTLDSTVIFERETNWQDKSYIQTLEPRLYYVNIPYRDQSRIPVFDSGLSDFNFAQIFSENRYSGFDRINDANQLTAALTSRILDGTTGVERFKAMVGQRYYFKPQRTTLPGEATRAADFSNFIAAASGLVLPKTYADAAWEYNYRAGNNERFTLGARYQPELGKVISAGYRYNSDALTGKSTVDQLDVAGQWPLASNWYAVGRYNYSIRDKQLLEAIAGVEYNAGCWAARGVIQRLEAVSGTPNTTFFFQLELNDFVSVGSNPLGLLRRSIPGYGKTNELPGAGGL